jgi:hypothetical protein
VAIAGDIVDSVVVTGDNVNVELKLGPEQGALLERLARAQRPRKRRRPAPLSSVPSPYSDSVDRDVEADTLAAGLRERGPVNVHGEPGIGKTYVLLHAMEHGTGDSLPDGAIYRFAPGPLEDVMQGIFEEFYECEPPCKASDAQIRRDLEAVRALVVLDGVQLERDAAQQLPLAMPACRVVVASRERVLWEGTPLAVQGLAIPDALKLVAQELGREPTADEDEPARRICELLRGHPLRVREAVATALASGGTLAQIEHSLADASEAVADLAAIKLGEAGDAEKRLIAALDLFRGAPVGHEHLRAIADVANFDQVVSDAVTRHDVYAHSPRYTLSATLEGVAQASELNACGERALRHYIAWAEDTRRDPATQLREGPALLALMRWAAQSGRAREAIRLGQSIDTAFAAGRRWGSWRVVLETVLAASRGAGERSAEAWALHQLGTRAFCRGEVDAGVEMLRQALHVRRELDDEAGARITAHNLRIALRPASGWVRPPRLWLLVFAIIAVLAGAGIGAALSSSSGHHRPGPPGERDLAVAVTGAGTVHGGNGRLACPSRCKATFASGTVVALRAIAMTHSRFVAWSGACSGQGTCRITMTHNARVAAAFASSVPPIPTTTTSASATEIPPTRTSTTAPESVSTTTEVVHTTTEVVNTTTEVATTGPIIVH